MSALREAVRGRVQELLLPRLIIGLKNVHAKHGWRSDCVCEYCSSKREYIRKTQFGVFSVQAGYIGHDPWPVRSRNYYNRLRVDLADKLQHYGEVCSFFYRSLSLSSRFSWFYAGSWHL